MVEITKTNVSLGSAVVLLVIALVGINVTEEQINILYFCAAENTVRECIELTKYGVVNSTCRYFLEDGIIKSDRCTINRIYYPWKPVRDYIGIENPKIEQVVISSIQDCNIQSWNTTEKKYYNCTYAYIGTDKVATRCDINRTIIEHNTTICDPVGYNISISSNNYEIKGVCCGLFNITDGYEIVCKERINDICNPKCQQTSINPDEYDEYCMIYTITPSGIKKNLVGEYDYVLDNQIKLSTFKEEKVEILEAEI